MRSAISIALMLSITMSPLCAAAQDRGGLRGTDQPVVRAWSKIRTLDPGTEVTVRTPGSAPRTRYFISANDDEVTLLSTSDPALSTDMAKLLRRTAVEHPDYFAVRPGATFVVDGRVSIQSSGLFVGDREIAGFAQFIERIARADVEGALVQIQTGPASDSDVTWRKVRLLAPGTLITLTIAGKPARSSYLLTVDEMKLRVLNTSEPGLPAEAGRALRQAASEHPAQFVLAPDTAFSIDKQIALRPSGLFVGAQKVADYDQVVMEVTRSDVENGVVLLGNAPVMRRMERSTKIMLAVAIPLATILVISFCCVPRT